MEWIWNAALAFVGWTIGGPLLVALGVLGLFALFWMLCLIFNFYILVAKKLAKHREGK